MEHCQQRVVHDTESTQPSTIGLDLCLQHGDDGGRHLQQMGEVSVLEGDVRVPLLLGGRVPAEGGALEIVLLVDGDVIRHEVVHHHHADVALGGGGDAYQAEKARQQRALGAHHVRVVVGQHPAQELGLLLGDRLQQEEVVLGEVKHGAALTWRAELAERVISAQRHGVVLLRHAEAVADMTKREGRVVLDGELLGRMCRRRGGAARHEELLELGAEVSQGERPVCRGSEAADGVSDPQLEVHHDVPRRVALEDGLPLLHLAVPDLATRGRHLLGRRHEGHAAAGNARPGQGSQLYWWWLLALLPSPALHLLVLVV
mmetsp:Transcript_29150/g.68231  ORF Transcript_29150/g.68231 Transcript_29150/m.68231 type:complete len:316 (-) Transcript_29150:206-1153(-)